MLNISPFSFGLIIQQVFNNGSIYNPEILDITEETLHKHFLEGVRNIASVYLQTGYPTTNSSFPLDEKVKAFLVDLSAFAAAAPAVTEAAAPAAAVPAKEEVKEESKEFDEDMGFGLFD
ncbi:60S acidic ribosomal protein P0, partial [Ophiophagus hannah]